MISFKVLTEEDLALIHEKSLEILEHTGIVVKSRLILERMGDAGCKVDYDAWSLKIPADIVTKALNSSPKSFTLGGLNPDYHLSLGTGHSYLTTDGQGCFVADLESGQRRESTMQDVADSAIIADALDYIDMYWPLVCAADVAPEVRTLRELATIYRYTGKHVQSDVFTPAEVPYFMQLLETILGDRRQVMEKKIFSVVCCSVTPLKYEEKMMEACIELAQYAVPINILPMPIAGATAPASLLSTVLLNNVEVLGALTIFQVFSPGAPIIYGSSSSILDMKTGLFAVGAPEEGLLNAACAEMARYYGLPAFASGLASDAKEPGIQAALEKMASGITPWLAGADILGGAGMMETCQCLYFEQLVIDEEIFGFIKRIREGIRGGGDYIFSDLIKEVGAGGHFLSQKSTRRLLRQGEHYIPGLISREPYEIWENSPKKDLRALARDRVVKILKDRQREYLEPAVIAELEKIMQSAEKELCP